MTPPRCTHAHRAGGPTGFMRLLPREPHGWNATNLQALAATMQERAVPLPSRLQRRLPPAGYTYLCQFVDHDLTFDERLFGAGVGTAPVNARSPRFDLDAVYGSPGPEAASLRDGDRLALQADGRDFLRDGDGRARIADERNDANLVISQVHLAFARFHNRVVDGLAPGGRRYEQARRIVRQHYQWIVLHDLLPVLVGPQAAHDLRAGTRPTLYTPPDPAAVPLEFSAAAFRCGHSMVRDVYRLNLHGGHVLTFDRSRPLGVQAEDLRGGRPILPPMQLSWALFFPMPGAHARPQVARPINTRIAPSLHALPVDVAQDAQPLGRNLPFRNLHRGALDLELASGQTMARALQACGALDPAAPLLSPQQLALRPGLDVPAHDIGGTGVGRDALNQRLADHAPLWYYVLKEAEVQTDGVHLGSVGARLVGEVLVGLMRRDPASVLHTGWAPRAGEHGCTWDGHYGFVDLLTATGA